VTRDLEPVISLVVIGKKQRRRIRAVIDTGFSGYLCLPRKMIRELHLDFLMLTQFELADGQKVDMAAYRAKVEFQGSIRDIYIVQSESKDKLIGASLLEDQKLTIDYPARTVVLE
jgi:clan AA aspartic protease